MNWLKGLLAAALSGAASTAGAMLMDPDHFNTANLKHLGMVAGIGAVTGTVGYLKQSPLPNGTVADPTQAIDPKRFAGTMVLVLALTLPLLACANLTAKLPHLPDGSLDVRTLVSWVKTGVELDCQYAPTSSWCIFGRDGVKNATAAMDKNPANMRAAALESLRHSIAKWPSMDVVFGWIVKDLD